MSDHTTMSLDEARGKVHRRLADLRKDGRQVFRNRDFLDILTEARRSRSWLSVQLGDLADTGWIIDDGDGFYRFPAPIKEESKKTMSTLRYVLTEAVRAVFYLTVLAAVVLVAALLPGDAVDANVAGTFALLGMLALFDFGVLLPAWLGLTRRYR